MCKTTTSGRHDAPLLNAPSGIWCCVEDGTKQCWTMQVTKMCPEE